MDSLDLLRTAASGMDAQRAALDVLARNVAASQAAGPKGSYERLVPQFAIGDDGETQQVLFTGAIRQKDDGGGILAEMVSVLNASRAYEANVSVFEIGKHLAERTIDMGRL
jgi:flagellar basal body rod protein FlgC